ncbi:MAG TPA: CAP domain-containing protein [Crenotrichaceae bacterium]|nr:CAP domain-containing protein [Crenotrichaceae bacterium]
MTSNKLLLSIASILSIFSVSSTSYAGFEFCSGNSGAGGGSGTFQQQIPLLGIVEVGELPIGVSGIEINLKSNVDIDIQLYDKLTGEKIIHWPDGILSGHAYQSTDYNGAFIAWSGFNGDGSGFGNEYIKVSENNDPFAPTARAYIMKVFGYKAGVAAVNYSWNGAQCDVSQDGNGSFQQQIVKDAVVVVGDIPAGISNLKVQLDSPKDVDIQLYDTENGTSIIAWPNGILNGPSTQTTTYQGMTIRWSGFNGDGTSRGNEYIEITGNTSRKLTMKAFGYESGFATVNYSWGTDSGSTNPGNPPPQNSAEQQMKDQILDLINQARSVGRDCGNTSYSAVSPVSWNSQLYQAALDHSEEMAQNDYFSHTGLDGNSAGFRITQAGYQWSSYGENIAAGYSTPESVIQGWLASPGHCKNIMSSSVNNVGVGKATGGSYGTYWTQIFATHQ